MSKKIIFAALSLAISLGACTPQANLNQEFETSLQKVSLSASDKSRLESLILRAEEDAVLLERLQENPQAVFKAEGITYQGTVQVIVAQGDEALFFTEAARAGLLNEPPAMHEALIPVAERLKQDSTYALRLKQNLVKAFAEADLLLKQPEDLPYQILDKSDTAYLVIHQADASKFGKIGNFIGSIIEPIKKVVEDVIDQGSQLANKVISLAGEETYTLGQIVSSLAAQGKNFTEEQFDTVLSLGEEGAEAYTKGASAAFFGGINLTQDAFKTIFDAVLSVVDPRFHDPRITVGPNEAKPVKLLLLLDNAKYPVKSAFKSGGDIHLSFQAQAKDIDDGAQTYVLEHYDGRRVYIRRDGTDEYLSNIDYQVVPDQKTQRADGKTRVTAGHIMEQTGRDQATPFDIFIDKSNNSVFIREMHAIFSGNRYVTSPGSTGSKYLTEMRNVNLYANLYSEKFFSESTRVAQFQILTPENKPLMVDGKPFELKETLSKPIREEKVALRSVAHQKYVGAQNGGGAGAFANNPNRASDETFTLVYLSEDKVALKTANGHYLVAEENGQANASRTAIGPWETFTLMPQGGNKIALRSVHGKMLVAEENGALNANRTGVGPWETFELIQLEGPTQSTAQVKVERRIALRSLAHQKYVGAQNGGGAGAFASNPSQASDETLVLVPLGENKVALRSPTGHYYAAAANGSVNVPRQQVGEAETFHMEQQSDGSYAFKSHYGQYLVAEESGELNANRPAPGPWERFVLVELE